MDRVVAGLRVVVATSPSIPSSLRTVGQAIVARIQSQTPVDYGFALSARADSIPR